MSVTVSLSVCLQLFYQTFLFFCVSARSSHAGKAVSPVCSNFRKWRPNIVFLGFYFTFCFTLNVNILCVTRHSYGQLIDCSLFILIACR